MKKLIINGHAQHGKDFLADAVSKELGLMKLNASMFFAETVLMPAFPDLYPCVEAAYLDRVNNRELWYQMMRIGDWQRRFMMHSDVFCGHRNISEHQAMSNSGDYLRVWVSWTGKTPEGSGSTQWLNNHDIVKNHDLVFSHWGDGVGRGVAMIKEHMQ